MPLVKYVSASLRPASPAHRASQALDWLYSHYWLPSLSPTSTVPLLPLDALRPLLSTYKSLTKTSLRDASKTNKLKPELLKAYRGIEGWVLEAESLGRGRERALEGLVEAFLEVGGLVPTAKKFVRFEASPAGEYSLLLASQKASVCSIAGAFKRAHRHLDAHPLANGGQLRRVHGSASRANGRASQHQH